MPHKAGGLAKSQQYQDFCIFLHVFDFLAQKTEIYRKINHNAKIDSKKNRQTTNSEFRKHNSGHNLIREMKFKGSFERAPIGPLKGSYWEDLPEDPLRTRVDHELQRPYRKHACQSQHI